MVKGEDCTGGQSSSEVVLCSAAHLDIHCHDLLLPCCGAQAFHGWRLPKHLHWHAPHRVRTDATRFCNCMDEARVQVSRARTSWSSNSTPFSR